jgi:hypothetical protein
MAATSFSAIVAMLISLALNEAAAQVPDFCPGQPKIALGNGGYECAPRQYRPQPQVPQYIAPAPPTLQDNAIINAFQNLTSLLSRGRPLVCGDCTLSASLGQQPPNPLANVKPPPGFLDPFNTNPPAANVPPLPPGYSPFTRQPEIGAIQSVPPPPAAPGNSPGAQTLPPPGQSNKCYINPTTSEYVCGSTFQYQQ